MDNRKIFCLILDHVCRGDSIASIYKWGYSYVAIVNCAFKLQQEGLIGTDEYGTWVLTDKGKEEYQKLKEKESPVMLPRLEQYRIPKMSIEEVYLPE